MNNLAIQLDDNIKNFALCYNTLNNITNETLDKIELTLSLIEINDENFEYIDIKKDLLFDYFKSQNKPSDSIKINLSESIIMFGIRLRQAMSSVAMSGRRSFGNYIIANPKYKVYIDNVEHLYKIETIPVLVMYDDHIDGIILTYRDNKSKDKEKYNRYEPNYFYKKLDDDNIRLYVKCKSSDYNMSVNYAWITE